MHPLYKLNRQHIFPISLQRYYFFLRYASFPGIFFLGGFFFLGTFSFFLRPFAFRLSPFLLVCSVCLFCCRARGVGRLPRRRYSLRVRADSGLRSAPRYSIHPHYPSLHTISTVCPLHKPQRWYPSFRVAVYLR